MNILDKIIEHKRKEVAERKTANPTKQLENSPFFERTVFSLKNSIQTNQHFGIIAEFKRKSPSKGDINTNSTVQEVTNGYVKAGVAGISVLTDTYFFGGKSEDLTEARKHNDIPILRKDFIIDPYQIVEAKSIGADAILLIAEVLTKEEVLELSKFAKSLGLEILMEIHSKKQLEKVSEYIDVLGVNNRNLETFEVSIDNSLMLSNMIPPEMTKISESGIHDTESIRVLKAVGYQGFLIGERFMKTKKPGKSCGEFIQQVTQNLELSTNS